MARRAFTLPRGQSGTITVNSRVALDAAPASVVNTAVLNATNLSAAIQRTAPVAITSTTLLLGFKQVQGDLDPAFNDFDTIGRTSPGGGATYRAAIANISDVPVTDLVVIDTLPIPGDIGVVFPAATRIGLATDLRPAAAASSPRLPRP